MIEISYKNEQIKFFDRTNQWCWNSVWDADLGNIKKLIDKTLTEKYKGVEAFHFYNNIGDEWFFDPVIVESPAGNGQMQCKDSVGIVMHCYLLGMLSATDENKKLIEEVNKIQQEICELKSRRDELVEGMEKFKIEAAK